MDDKPGSFMAQEVDGPAGTRLYEWVLTNGAGDIVALSNGLVSYETLLETVRWVKKNAPTCRDPEVV